MDNVMLVLLIPAPTRPALSVESAQTNERRTYFRHYQYFTTFVLYIIKDKNLHGSEDMNYLHV